MRFSAKAITPGGSVITVPVDAGDRAQAARLVEAQGLSVVALKRELELPWRARGRFDLLQFAQQLASLLEAGLNIVEATDVLAEREQDPSAKAILTEVVKEVHEGKQFSQAIERFPAAFPTLFVAMVRASEKTGGIRDALARFIGYRTQVDRVRSRVMSAAIYPLLLLVIGAGVVLFLLGYVVPRFSRIYEDVKVDLPWASIVLMELGRAIDAHPWPWLLGFAALIGGAAYAALNPVVRQRALERLRAIPAVERFMAVIELARLYRTIGMLLRSGVPILPALALSGNVLAPAAAARLAGAAERVREGRAFSAAMHEQGFATPVAMRMLSVAERSGDLGGMLERVALFHEDEISQTVERFSRLFEPLLMAGVGVAIGVIVVLMYMPIFELAGSIQ